MESKYAKSVNNFQTNNQQFSVYKSQNNPVEQFQQSQIRQNQIIQQQQQYQSTKSMQTLQKTQQQSTPYFIKSFCEQHPEEYITNFCNYYTCLQALCPDCIDQHISMHRQQNQFPQIESIKTVKQNCTKKIKQASQELITQLEELENKNMFLAQDFQDEGLLTLKNQRQNILEIVNQYFDGLELRYKERINEFSNKGYEMNNLLEKIKGMLNELEFLHANIESPNQINTIKKVCQMDYRNILRQYQDELKKIDSEQSMYSIDVNINPKRLDYIQQELFRYTNLGILNEKKTGFVSDQESFNGQIPANQQNKQNLQFQSQQYHPQQLQAPPEHKKNLSSTSEPIVPTKIHQNQQIVQSKFVSESQFHEQQQNVHETSQSSMKNINVYNNMNLKEIDKKFNKRKINIETYDYFEPECQTKYLHFFQDGENILHLCDLEKLVKQKNTVTQFEQVQLNQNLQVQEFHKSIITSTGQIFVTGGKIDSDRRSNKVYQFDYFTRQLIEKQPMIEPRSSHGILYHNGYIYVIGGFVERSEIKGSCERYSILHDKWESIADLNYPVINPAVTMFKNEFIIKIGGLDQYLNLNNTIEVYNFRENKWNSVDAKFSQECGTNMLKNFRLLNSSCAIQINENEVYVFGGYYENKESSQTFVMGTEMDETYNIEVEIKQINETPLIYPEGFWNNNPISYQGKIYALQNINDAQTEQCLRNARVVLNFDGSRWSEISLVNR